jgi:membrane associated rhomboid family serine protease
MALISSFNEDRPVSYFRGYPIYYATLLTVAYAVGIVLTAVCQAAGISLEPFIFAPHRSLFGGQIWQLVTCTFINEPGFFSIFGLLFFYVSAVEVEKYLGMRRFLILYGLLLATPLLVLTAWMAVFGPSYAYLGNTEVAVGFFLAFCALYPNVQWWGVLPLKWVGVGCFVLALLVYLSRSQWAALCLLCAVSGVAFGYIRVLQSGINLPRFPRLFARKARPKIHVVSKPSPARPVSSPKQPVETTAVEIDELLDKISKKGLGSLTAQERAALERAREKLLEKDKKS